MRECFFVSFAANRPPAQERGMEEANLTLFLILEVRYDGEEDY